MLIFPFDLWVALRKNELVGDEYTKFVTKAEIRFEEEVRKNKLHNSLLNPTQEDLRLSTEPFVGSTGLSDKTIQRNLVSCSSVKTE